MRAASVFCWVAASLIACSADDRGRPAPSAVAPADVDVHATVDRLMRLRPFADRISPSSRLRPVQHGFAIERLAPSVWTTLGEVALEVVLPRTADAPVRLSRRDDPDAWLEITLGDAPVEGGTLFNTLVFPGVAVDAAVIVERTRVEALHVLHVRTPSVREQLRLGPGLVGLRIRGRRLEAYDAAGRVRLETAPLFAIDSTGHTFELRAELHEGGPRAVELELQVDAPHAVLPLVIDPAWSATVGPMVKSHENHGAIAITGGVLVCGAGAETFASSTNTFTAVASPWPGKTWVQLAKLADGRILVSGGVNETSAHLYSPITRTFTATGSLSQVRGLGSTFTLPNGKVLVAGGLTTGYAALTTTEIYDPTAGTWSAGPPLPSVPSQTFAQLDDGRVIGVSGFVNVSIFSPTTGTWTNTATADPLASNENTFTALTGTRALWVAGQSGNDMVAKVVLFDAAGPTVKTVAPLPFGRSRHRAVRLKDGRVLVVGGNDVSFDPIADADVYDPVADTWSSAGALNAARRIHEATLLDDGRVLVTSGRGIDGTHLSTAELFTLQPNGAACTSAGICSSGRCVDGVCCNAACTGACESCNGSAPGTCTGLTGAPHAGRGCGAYATCSAGSCTTTCSTDNACASTHHCVGGACALRKDVGLACAAARECLTGVCADGRCCDQACNGQCEACDVTGKQGTCWPALGRPHGTRTSCGGAADAICGNVCDGSDRAACHIALQTVACGTNACGTGLETHASFCNGSGACGDLAKTCGAYACGATACKTTCSTSADCAAGFGCKAAACVARDGLGLACADGSTCKEGLFCTDRVCCGVAACEAGSKCVAAAGGALCRKDAAVACSADAECASAHCVDGVCCDRACDGQCEACDATGKRGTCTVVVGAPHGTRSACSTGAGTCDALSCDGITATSCGGRVGKEVVCREPSCAEGSATAAATCDGLGACPAAVKQSCEGFACDAVTHACRKSCGSNDDCRAGYRCEAGTCKAKAGSCSADGSALVAVSGTSTSCAPYVCSDDVCLARCEATGQCAAGFVCDVAAGTCVGLTAPAEDAGGCSTSRTPRGFPTFPLFAFASSLLVLAGCTSREPERTVELARRGDPAWTVVTPAPATFHSFGSTIVLADGRVFAFGGEERAGLYDPTSKTWSASTAGTVAPQNPIVQKLADGRILIAGGYQSFPQAYLSTSQVWSANGTWATTAPMNHGANYTWAPVSSGRVLAFATSGLNNDPSSAQIFDPTNGSWTVVATPTTILPGSPCVLAPLPGGKALLSGGIHSEAEIYDAATNSWSPAAPMHIKRMRHRAIPLADGRVLVAGGYEVLGGSLRVTSTVEIYDPVANTWTERAPLATRRTDHTATLLSDGRILVTGGRLGLSTLSSTELYDVAANRWIGAGNLTKDRYSHLAAPLPNGSVLVIGGQTGAGEAEIFVPDSIGVACAAGGECKSGFCVDGVCCASASCTADQSCALGTKKGTCSTKAGASCASAGACGSGFCVDGVCCDRACSGTCEACNVFGALGTCTTVSGSPRGTRPACDDGAGDRCKEKTCDGTDGAVCHFRAAGATACGAATCTQGIETHASTCDGTGKCADVAKTCDRFACGPTACRTTCTKDDECTAGAWCSSGACVARSGLGAVCTGGGCAAGLSCVDGVCCGSSTCPTGSVCNAAGHAGTCTKKNAERCGVDAECASGSCADSVCCETKCSGQCEACDVTGSVGRCVAVVGAPHGGRAACATDTSDACKTKLCDGATTATCAAFVGAEVACRPAACADGRATTGTTCDGKGTCPAPIATSCAEYACGETGCRTSCSTTSDCASGHECVGSTCKPITATCSADGNTAIIVDGPSERCYPLTCRAGACLTECVSSEDCASGFICDSTSKKCVPPTVEAEEGGCALGRPASSRRAGAEGVLLAALVLAERRRRRGPTAS